MDLYRVFAYDHKAQPGEPGHPQYIYPHQVIGRWDNAEFYRAWYLSFTPAGAVGEAFGNLSRWSLKMFQVPYLPNGRRALAVFEIPDDTRLLDLNDPAELVRRNMRPTQIVNRNLKITQPLALSVFRETDSKGAPRYSGMTWWSYHRPHWSNAVLFDSDEHPAPLRLRRIETLSITHPAVTEAAASLYRELT